MSLGSKNTFLTTATACNDLKSSYSRGCFGETVLPNLPTNETRDSCTNEQRCWLLRKRWQGVTIVIVQDPQQVSEAMAEKWEGKFARCVH